MILNKKYRILAWFLSIAFVLPIIVKAEHLMSPNHKHQEYSCTHNETNFQHVCQIQEFDYFYFTATNITSIPAVTIFKFETPIIESVKKSYKESKLPYGLRAPPFIVS